MRKIYRRIFTSLLIIGCISWLYWGNESIQITKYTIKNEQIPEALSGFQIVQVSDLHNKSFGDQQKNLINRIKEAEPNMIAVTGDVIDSRRTDLRTALTFFEKAIDIAPIYYVPGNHEARVEEYEAFKTTLIDLGVHVLDNRVETIQFKGEEVMIAGIEDPAFHPASDEQEAVDSLLNTLQMQEESYTILLSHRPEMYELYEQHHANLIFTGHAHGGQIRIPFVGGIIAPGQGIIPKYTEGTFTTGDMTMIVSRGLGNSLFPIRVNNRPELLVTTLHSDESM